MKYNFLVGLALVTAVPAYADSYDSCKDLLRNGVFDILQTQNSYDAKLARHHIFCSTAAQYNLDSDEFEDWARDYASKTKAHRYGTSNDTDFNIGPFKWVGGGYNRFRTNASDEDLSLEDKVGLLTESKTKIRDYYRDECGNDKFDNSLQTEAIVLKRVANAQMVDAWKECMLHNTRNGLFVDVIKTIEDHEASLEAPYAVNLHWRSEYGFVVSNIAMTATHNIDSTLTPDRRTERQREYNNILLSPSVRVSQGIQVIHTDRSEVGLITFNAIARRFTETVSVKLPKRILVQELEIELDIQPDGPTRTEEVVPLFRIVDLTAIVKGDRGAPMNGEFIWHPQDLNSNHGGKYIYIGCKKEKREDDAGVTSIGFVCSSDELSSSEVQRACLAKGLTKFVPCDLNKGASGKYIYLGWSCDEPGKAPISEITFQETSRNFVPYIPGWEGIDQDLCEGSGGSYIFASYQRVN